MLREETLKTLDQRFMILRLRRPDTAIAPITLVSRRRSERRRIKAPATCQIHAVHTLRFFVQRCRQKRFTKRGRLIIIILRKERTASYLPRGIVMKKAGINLVEVKERNRALLLQSICTADTITRSELSERLQLSPMTVTNITSELLQKKIIEEVPPPDPVRMPGRTPMLLRIGDCSPVILGVYISRTCLHGMVCGMPMQLLTQEKQALDQTDDEQSLMQKLRDMITRLTDSTKRPILALGISTVGIINAENTGIAYVTDFFGIRSLDLQQALQPDFPFPIFVGNDMSASGLSEMYFGAGKNVDSFLYVGLAHGLGAAVVSHHELLDACGEIGHTSINDNGPQCACGSRGCLELYASTPTILRQIREECGVNPENMAQAVSFAQTDRTAYTIFYNALRHLAYGLNNYLNLIHVSTIVLGHDAALLPDEFIELLEQWLSRINVSVHQGNKQPKFVKARFGEDSPVYGSICLVLQQLFQGELFGRLMRL